MRRGLLSAVSIISIAYPFLWWLWRDHGTALAMLALCMALLWAMRAVLEQGGMRAVSAVVAALFVCAAMFRQGAWLLWYPLVVNVLFLALFAFSLYRGMPMVERFARLRHADLPDAACPYLRRVTQVWCGFFILNGAVIVVFILIGRDDWWTLYTGVIAYVLMGVLFVGEWCYRHWVLKRHL